MSAERILELQQLVAGLDEVISKLSQLEYVSRNLNGHQLNLDLCRQRWRAELLRAGATFELKELGAPRAAS